MPRRDMKDCIDMGLGTCRPVVITTKTSMVLSFQISHKLAHPLHTWPFQCLGHFGCTSRPGLSSCPWTQTLWPTISPRHSDQVLGQSKLVKWESILV